MLREFKLFAVQVLGDILYPVDWKDDAFFHVEPPPSTRA
jgi:hypothetical protein